MMCQNFSFLWEFLFLYIVKKGLCLTGLHSTDEEYGKNRCRLNKWVGKCKKRVETYVFGHLQLIKRFVNIWRNRCRFSYLLNLQRPVSYLDLVVMKEGHFRPFWPFSHLLTSTTLVYKNGFRANQLFWNIFRKSMFEMIILSVARLYQNVFWLKARWGLISRYHVNEKFIGAKRPSPLPHSIDILLARNSRLTQRETNNYITRCTSELAWPYLTGSSPG